MSVSILVVDDEPDVGEMFRQRFRRDLRRGQRARGDVLGRDADAVVAHPHLDRIAQIARRATFSVGRKSGPAPSRCRLAVA